MSQTTAVPKRPRPQDKAGANRLRQTGKISGRVFLITKGGDLKPARMANVHLLLWTGDPSAEYLEKDSAGFKFSIESSNQSAQRGENYTYPEQLCLAYLLKYHKALLYTLEWAKAEKKVDQVLATTTDEEQGRFTFLDVPIGIYTLLADGHAGVHQA